MYGCFVYNKNTGEVVDKTIYPTGTQIKPEEVLELYAVGNQKDKAEYACIEVTKEQYEDSNTQKAYNQVINGKLVFYPMVRLESNLSQITTTQSCIVTATIIPPEGLQLEEEELTFVVYDENENPQNYNIMTESGRAAIEYSNANPGKHRIEVHSSTHYGSNRIEIEVV